MVYYVCLGIVFQVLALVGTPGSADPAEPITEHFKHEETLQRTLLKTYNKNVRPATNLTVPVLVDITFTFPRLEKVETSTDTVVLSFLTYMSWIDPRLSWNKTEYGGLESTRFRSDQLWTPDILVYNRSPLYPEEKHHNYIIVYNRGFVFFVSSQTVSFFCSINLSNFPYDSQNCTLTMGSWTYSGREIHMLYAGKEGSQRRSIDNSAVTTAIPALHPQWSVKEMYARVLAQCYTNPCTERYLVLEIEVLIDRVTTYFRFVLIGPAIFLSFLVPVIFTLPVGSSAKAIYGMMVLICTILMILILQEAVPFDHSSVPRIAVFYFTTLILNTIALCLSIFTTTLSEKGLTMRSPPAWLNSLCIHSRVIKCILCMETGKEAEITTKTMNTLLLEDNHDDEHLPDPSRLQNIDINASDDIAEVANNTRKLAECSVRQNAYEKLNREWRYIATTLDRLFFLIFFILFIMTSAMYLS